MDHFFTSMVGAGDEIEGGTPRICDSRDRNLRSRGRRGGAEIATFTPIIAQNREACLDSQRPGPPARFTKDEARGNLPDAVQDSQKSRDSGGVSEAS